MNRPPRDPKEPLFSKRVLLLSTLQGLSVLAMLLTIFGVCLARGQGELDARTLAFTTLIIANLGLMMTNRSWTSTIDKIHRAPNAALWWVTGGTVVFLGLVLTIPFLREIFRFSVIHPVERHIETVYSMLTALPVTRSTSGLQRMFDELRVGCTFPALKRIVARSLLEFSRELVTAFSRRSWKIVKIRFPANDFLLSQSEISPHSQEGDRESRYDHGNG